MPTSLMQRAHDEAVRDDDTPKLPEKSTRRSFTAEYKLRMVAEYDACVGDGDKGALLRREGLYSSHITEWRRARDNAAQGALSASQRKTKVNPETAALEKANKRIERLEKDLKKHKLALDSAGTTRPGRKPKRDRGVLLRAAAPARNRSGLPGIGKVRVSCCFRGSI